MIMQMQKLAFETGKTALTGLGSFWVGTGVSWLVFNWSYKATSHDTRKPVYTVSQTTSQ